MSDPLPPPGPPAASLPPPPPPIAAPRAAVASSSGLRTATTVLFWCVAAMMLPFIAVLAYRKSVWSDFEEGRLSFADLDKLDDADAAVAGVSGIVLLVALATTIVLSIWSLRVAGRARAAGATRVSPGLACGGWYIPFANTIVPFVQLRRVARHGGRPAGALNTWQALTIATLVLSFIFRGTGDVETAESMEDVSVQLSLEIAVAVLIAIVTVVMAYVATRALRDLDPPAPPAASAKPPP